MIIPFKSVKHGYVQDTFQLFTSVEQVSKCIRLCCIQKETITDQNPPISNNMVMSKTADFNTNLEDNFRQRIRNKTMLRFLFKSQLSDRNAIPIYIALKTPVVCI